MRLLPPKLIDATTYLLWRAELGDRAIQHVEVIEEIDSLEALIRIVPELWAFRGHTVHREPLVEIFAFWEHYSLS